MNAHKSPLVGTTSPARNRVVPTTPKMVCPHCEGKCEAEYMALTEDRYHWRACHHCEGEGVVAPFCQLCETKLTVDGYCYSCEEYGEGFVYVERIAPGRIAL
jgi:hypothetical protein